VQLAERGEWERLDGFLTKLDEQFETRGAILLRVVNIALPARAHKILPDLIYHGRRPIWCNECAIRALDSCCLSSFWKRTAWRLSVHTVGLHQPRQAKIGDFGETSEVEQRVFGLNVGAQFLAGGRSDPFAALAHNLKCRRGRRLASQEQAPRRVSLHKFHHQKQAGIVLAKFMNRHDVRVGEPGQQLRFANEAGRKRWVGRLLEFSRNRSQDQF